MAGFSPAIPQQFPPVPGPAVIGRIGITRDTGPSQPIPSATLNRQLGNPLIPEIYATPYGAKCDGTPDDSPAVQAAVNASDAAGGPTVVLPAGPCRFNSTVFLNKWAASGIL